MSRAIRLNEYHCLIGVDPLEYDIELTFLNEFTALEGKVDIVFKFKQPKIHRKILLKQYHRPTSYGVAFVISNSFELLHINLLAADSIIQLREGDGQQLTITNTQREPEGGLSKVIVYFEETPAFGSYGQISISYKRRGNQLRMGTVSDASNRRELVYHSIHLQQDIVCNLIPYFNPNLKAKISLVINQPGLESCVISNMPPLQAEEIVLSRGDGTKLKQTRFEQTSISMPLSSIAFAIGPYKRVEETTKRQPINSTISKVNFFEPVLGHPGRWRFALEFATEVMNWFRVYLRGDEHPLGNLNLVAATSFYGSNSVRNEPPTSSSLGIVLMDPSHLLVDEKISSIERKIEVALNVAILVAGQWFGEFLAPKAPKDLWITQGLQLHLATRAVREVRPEYQVDHYVKSFRQSAPDLKDPNDDGEMKFIINLIDNLRNPSHVVVQPERSAELFDLLRANIVRDQTKFDNIIRSLLNDRLTIGGGINGHKLARAFAIKWFTRRNIGRIIKAKLKYNHNRYINVDLVDNWVVFRIGHDKDALIWPVLMKVQFFSADGSQNSVSKVPVNKFGKGKFIYKITKVPKWFDFSENSADWLRVVVGENQLMPYHQIYYSNKLLARLRRPIRACQLSTNERIDLIRQQIDAFIDADIIGKQMGEFQEDSLDKVHDIKMPTRLIKYYSDEQDVDVLLEVLRAIQRCRDHNEQRYSNLFQDDVRRIYGRLKVGARETELGSPSEQRAKFMATFLLMKQCDEKLINKAIDFIQSAGENGTIFQKEPVYMTVKVAVDLWRRDSKGKTRHEPR